ncbi:MAG: hypothetical protein EBR26_02355 [Microbacteriaceae bacterium]|nr:hypothetical protein [Microbacteriaceae bacterium]
MESLALLVSIILLVIYLSSIIAFGLSWIRRKSWMIVTIVFALFGLASGIWLAITLINGNGLFIGAIPVLFASFSIWNTLRRNKVKP